MSPFKVDVVPAPVAPDVSDFSEYIFTDLNGNGLDDGQKTQANIYRGLINAMGNNPGISVLQTSEWTLNTAVFLYYRI